MAGGISGENEIMTKGINEKMHPDEVKAAHILVVDDDRGIRRSIQLILQAQGFVVEEARSGEDALSLLDRNIYDVVLSDLVMKGLSGMDVLQHSKRTSPDSEVIMMTAHGSIDNAVQAMRMGAFEYLTKPFNEDELLIVVSKAIERNRLRVRVRTLERSMQAQFGVSNILTINDKMKQLIRSAISVAQTDSNVLITGESGTGKELIAGLIHTKSQYGDKPFIPVNCGGLPEQLLESELFGHVKGAFTGAVSNKKGLVEEADGGTLFLDEIAETSPTLQVKLLRFIQNGEIRRLGENVTRRVKVRIVAATNKNLQEAMQNGEFREDLYYRISVIPLHIPPLRERPEDIQLLAQHYLRFYSEKFHKDIRHISQEAQNLLLQYAWPGNVRELVNAIEHGVALCSGDTLGPTELPLSIQQKEAVPVGGEGLTSGTLADIERNYILKVLQLTGWNQKKACGILGLSKTTLYRRLKEYSIQPRRMIEASTD